MTDRGRLQLLFVLGTLTHSALLASRVAIPIAALDAGSSPFTVGLLMAAFALLPAVLGVQAGRWIDRAGLQLPLRASMFLLAGAFLAAAWRPTVEMLFPVHAAMGLSVSVFHVANSASVGAIGRPEDRARNYSWMSLTGAVALVVGPSFGGFLIDRLGVRGAFAVLGALPLVNVALLLAMGRTLSSPPKPAAAAVDRGRLRDLALDPQRFGVLVIGAIFGLAWDIYSFIVPVHGRSLGMSGMEIGSILSAFGIATVIVRGAMPVVVRALRDWTVVIGALVLSTTVFALFPFFGALSVLYSLSFTYGLAHGAVQPVLSALLYEASPEGRVGELLGLRSVLQNLLHTAAPPLFGLIGSALGMMPVFFGGAAALGVGTWLSVTRWRRRRTTTSL